jgi:hypothetical protein
MVVNTLANQNVPNGTNSEVTLFKDISKDIICFKNKDGVVIPVGGGGVVYDGLVATGTSQATTKTTLNYGINVFSTITNTNYAARLPIANTGQVVTVVNNTNSALALHPSMNGGSINNTLNGIASVPPDGKSYSFYCIKNPLPGAWTWSAPAIGQFESDTITMTVSSGTGGGGTNPYFSAYNNIVKSLINSPTTYAAGQDGKFKPPVLGIPNGNNPIYFRPDIPWGTITKIKVYTNSTTPSKYYLAANGECSYYDISTNDYIQNGPSVAAGFTWDTATNNVVAGTPISAGFIQPYVGAPGTYWGEVSFPNPVMASNNGANFTSSVIGNEDLGNEPFTGTFPAQYIGQLINNFYSCFLSFQMQPMFGVAYGANQAFQVKFIIEHT